MKIESIKLGEKEVTAIVKQLTDQFNTEDKKQSIEFDVNLVTSFGEELIFNIESTLELSTEIPEADENNQTAINYRSVVKFSITFFYDGEEIKVNTDKIYELIHSNYEI